MAHQLAILGDQDDVEDVVEDDAEESEESEEIIYEEPDDQYTDDEYIHALFKYIEQQLAPPTIISCNMEVYNIPYKLLFRHDNIKYPFRHYLHDKKVALAILTGYRPGCNTLETFKLPHMYSVPYETKLYFNYNIPNITINIKEDGWFRNIFQI
jgi:hypothetical protein